MSGRERESVCAGERESVSGRECEWLRESVSGKERV